MLAEPGPAVQLSSFLAGGGELSLFYSAGDPEIGIGKVCGWLKLAVLALPRRAPVEFPFPQRAPRRA